MRQHTVDGVQLDCAFCQLFLRLAKTFLNVAPNRAEGGNDKSPNHENEKVRQVSAGNFEGVVGLRKEVVEAQRGQYDRHHGGSVARVPGGDGDGEGKDRHFHAAELIILESEGQAERDCDGNNSQAVARDPRLETVKSSIPARQKAPGTGISPWLREVSHYISRGVLRTGITARQCPVYFVAGDRIEAERRALPRTNA